MKIPIKKIAKIAGLLLLGAKVVERIIDAIKRKD